MPYLCQKCETEIVWLKHHQTRKPNPVEAAPSEKGNLVVSRKLGLYRMATPEEIETGRTKNKNLYISHFATCEHAKNFRK